MTLDELESLWSGLSPPQASEGIAGRRAPGLPHDRPVYIAVDGRGHRHLLVQVPDDTPTISQGDTRGLQVTTSRFEVGSNPESLYVDLVCIDSSQYPTFSAVTQDMLRTLISSSGAVRDDVRNALARWRVFWSNRPDGLSHEDAIGLFGELWFMYRWLGPISPESINRWQVTANARHDFQWLAASVEVKTATVSTSGDPIHHIASLDQLAAPEEGDLYLFSLQVREDALSSNTLHSLVERITSDLADHFPALSEFNDKLGFRGYTPADGQHAARQLRVMGERLYYVTDNFPRLSLSNFEPEGLPSGIINLRYDLDLAACGSWLIAIDPKDSPFATQE